jgi:hypothetical protein
LGGGSEGVGKGECDRMNMIKIILFLYENSIMKPINIVKKKGGDEQYR